MTTSELKDAVRLAILFYESRGWDWLDVVEFLLTKRVR